MSKIIGNIIATPNPRPDWNQTDETKADYIKNKPDLAGFSNALTETASGIGAVRMNDISPLTDAIKINAKSKNLLASPFGELKVENGKTYTLSIALKEDISYGTTYSLAWYDVNGNWMNHELVDSSGLNVSSYTFTAGANGNYGYYILNVDFTEDMFEYVQLEEGSEATEYVPNTENIEDAGIKSYGKNLYNFTKSTSLNYDLPDYLPGLELTISTDRTTNDGTIWFIKSNDEFNSYTDVGYLGTATVTEAVTYTVEEGYKYRIMFSEEALAVTNKIQVELSATATEYEEYKEPIDGINVIYPTTTLVSGFAGVQIEATYNKDINRVMGNVDAALDAIITMQNQLIGGETV